MTNADGSGQTRITNTPNPVQNVDPAGSPDGKQIAFFSDRDNPGIEEDLWIMNADGSSPRQLTFNTVVDFSVDWAPDGSRLVFSQDVPGGTGNLWLINPDGSGLRQLSFFTTGSYRAIRSPLLARRDSDCLHHQPVPGFITTPWD